MQPLRVTYTDGMVNVDSDDVCFVCLPGMYEGNRCGIGLQVNDQRDCGAMERMCAKIAAAVVEFHAQATAPSNETNCKRRGLR